MLVISGFLASQIEKYTLKIGEKLQISHLTNNRNLNLNSSTYRNKLEKIKYIIKKNRFKLASTGCISMNEILSGTNTYQHASIYQYPVLLSFCKKILSVT